MSEEDKDYLKKLSVIPKFELVSLLKSIYSNKSEKLKQDIKESLGVNPREPFKKLEKLNSPQLISLCHIQKEHPIKKINELYDEWWQSQNPSLFFCEILRIKSENFFKLNIKQQLEKLKESFEEINKNFTKEKRSDFSDIKIINHKLVNNILETEFEYQKRVDYINPKTRTPSFVYSLTEGIIWVSKEQKSIIIKVDDAALLSKMSERLRILFECDIVRFNLTKELMNDIFGFDSIRKANYIEPEQQDNEHLIKKNVSDPRFSNKTEAKSLDARCNRPFSFHNISINKKRIGVSINEKGKIRIYTNIKKSELKEWAMEIIKEIIAKTSAFNKEDFRKYIGIRNFDDIPSLKGLNNKSKDILKQISMALFKLKDEGKKEHQMNFSLGDIYNNLKDYFYLFFSPVCPDCNDTSYLCASCQSIDSIVLSGPGMELKCSNCGRKIEDVSKDLFCFNDKTHHLDGGKFDNVLAVGNRRLSNTINEISEFCKSKFKLENNEVITMKGRTLSYEVINYKSEYLFDELLPFSKITLLKNIPENTRQTQLKNLKDASERCVNFKEDADCKNCIINQKGLCIPRLIATFVDSPQLKAHSGYEFGDLSFKIKLDGKLETAICLVKSCKNQPKGYKLTINNNDRLLQQLMKSLIDGRVAVIGIVSTAVIDDNLKELMSLLIKRFGKKGFFIERENVIRLVSDYLKDIDEFSNKNYWFP